MAGSGEETVKTDHNDQPPVVMLILNGKGIPADKDNSVFSIAETPVMDELKKSCPLVKGLSSGMAVGLPGGQAGNSEVGHLNLGAGRIVYQELTKISKEIQHEVFFENPTLLATVGHCLEKDSCLHIMGLVSDGGVHSHISHLYALLELAKRHHLVKVYVHCFLDGCDTEPCAALYYMDKLQSKMRELGVGEIATCMGRSYAMDRSGKYERIKLSYFAMVRGEGNKAANPEEAIRAAYARGETDEFLVPTVIVNGGVPVGTINDDDAVIFFNYRGDRAKELTRAFCDEEFKLFKREIRPDVFFVNLVECDPDIGNKHAAFYPAYIENNLVAWLSQSQIRTALITESEGASLLTFSFLGNSFEPFENADVTIVPSAKVQSYDLKPEMSTEEVAGKAVEAIESGRYSFVVLNFVNMDIMGHIAKEEPLKKAVEAADRGIGKVLSAVRKTGGIMFICADHGNAERIRSGNDNVPCKANTNNPVPFMLVNANSAVKLRPGGCLADVAPTILHIMGVPKPKEMTGRSLIQWTEES